MKKGGKKRGEKKTKPNYEVSRIKKDKFNLSISIKVIIIIVYARGFTAKSFFNISVKGNKLKKVL